ncbi:MAG TPA: ACT domain-containing protein [Anaerolineaceae bacterium]
MTGERNLERLMEHMEPELQTGVYVFCTFSTLREEIPAICWFCEKEGWTAIVQKEMAERLGLLEEGGAAFESAWITLKVHSDLQAVGFLAAISQALAAEGIPCNVVSGYYHDHLFVPVEKSQAVLEILARLQSSGG